MMHGTTNIKYYSWFSTGNMVTCFASWSSYCAPISADVCPTSVSLSCFHRVWGLIFV